MGAKHLTKALVHNICDCSEKTSNFEYIFFNELLLPAYRVAQQLQFAVFYSSLKQRVRKLYPLVLALF